MYSPVSVSPEVQSKPSSRDEARVAQLIRQMPAGGMFAQKAWRWSPRPFPLAPATVRHLDALGNRLARFQRSADSLYQRSRKGSLPGWIAEVLDRGKPAALLGIADHPGLRDSLPRVIRPDLILTDQGFTLTELDSVPGGIGLTAWLGESYAGLDPDSAIVGGGRGMIDGFQSIFRPGRSVDILVSEEAGDYRPEMEWLTGRLEGEFDVASAEGYSLRGRDLYRFFELFDLPNLPSSLDWARAHAEGEIDLTSPFKPHLEEKAWSALFWTGPLRETWRRELRDSHWRYLQSLIPYTWLVNPEPIPDHAVLPRLEIQSFGELRHFSQSKRDLVLKISGFSELAWGSRSVSIGSDQSQEEWSEAVDQALDAWDQNPYILQAFHKGRLVEHPYLDEDSGRIEILEGRVRLCPYYFVEAANPKRLRLGGVLATICPADKKILHGMSEAILVPCAIHPDGY